MYQLPFPSRNEATRTPDPYVPNVVRYQLRYIPILRKSGAKVMQVRAESSSLGYAERSLPSQKRCKGNGFFRDMHFFVPKNLSDLKKYVSLHPHLNQMYLVS